MAIVPKSMKTKASQAYDQATVARQSEMLGNRVKKTLKHMRPQFERKQIGAFRLYDWEIPEIRAVVDWYEGHIVVGEYVRSQTEGIGWLEAMADGLAMALELPRSHIHLRRRNTRPKEGLRYSRLAPEGTKLSVREDAFHFLVDLDSYLDTGLFTDHRLTRARIRSEAQGKHVLNLFCYTGSFTVYAAAGGAASTCSVDLSEHYLDWALQNLRNNKLEGHQHRMVRSEGRQFLQDAARRGQTWDLIILDPPSFSYREGLVDFDIQRDHRSLVKEALAVLSPKGTLYFSTNHQRFIPALELLHGVSCEEISAQLLPVDYKGRTPHRLFQLQK